MSQFWCRMIKIAQVIVACLLFYAFFFLVYWMWPDGAFKNELFAYKGSLAINPIFGSACVALLATLFIVGIFFFFSQNEIISKCLFFPVAEEIGFRGILLFAIFRYGWLLNFNRLLPHATFLTIFFWSVAVFTILHIPEILYDFLVHHKLDLGRPLDGAIIGIVNTLVVIFVHFGLGLNLAIALIIAICIHAAINGIALMLHIGPWFLLLIVRIIGVILALVFIWNYFETASRLWLR